MLWRICITKQEKKSRRYLDSREVLSTELFKIHGGHYTYDNGTGGMSI